MTEVKKELSKQAKSLGAVAAMSFKYGQMKHNPFDLLFSFKWDTESWHGEGDAVFI